MEAIPPSANPSRLRNGWFFILCHGPGRKRPGVTAGPSQGNVASPDADDPWRARARDALRRALSSEDVEVFTGCAVALGKAGDPRDAHALLTVLARRYSNPQVRESLVLGLGLLGSGAPGVRPALERILADAGDSARLRGFAALALGLSGDRAALPLRWPSVSSPAASSDAAVLAMVCACRLVCP